MVSRAWRAFSIADIDFSLWFVVGIGAGVLGCLSFKTGFGGEGGGESQSDTSVLAMGESGSYGGITSPGTVIRRLRGRLRMAAATALPRGGFSVSLADVPFSIFLPLRERLTCVDG